MSLLSVPLDSERSDVLSKIRAPAVSVPLTAIYHDFLLN